VGGRGRGGGSRRNASSVHSLPFGSFCLSRYRSTRPGRRNHRGTSRRPRPALAPTGRSALPALSALPGAAAGRIGDREHDQPPVGGSPDGQLGEPPAGLALRRRPLGPATLGPLPTVPHGAADLLHEHLQAAVPDARDGRPAEPPADGDVKGPPLPLPQAPHRARPTRRQELVVGGHHQLQPTVQVGSDRNADALTNGSRTPERRPPGRRASGR
jgi:hypothetical protein